MPNIPTSTSSNTESNVRSGFTTSSAGVSSHTATCNGVKDGAGVSEGSQSQSDVSEQESVSTGVWEDASADRPSDDALSHSGDDDEAASLWEVDEELGEEQSPASLYSGDEQSSALEHRDAADEQWPSPASDGDYMPAPDTDNDGEGSANSPNGAAISETEDEPVPQPSSPPPPPQSARSTKKTKAYMNIVSENMRGRGSARIRGNMKWKKIAEDVRGKKIGIMALQETHLNEAHVDEIHSLHRHLLVVNSSMPNNPTGSGGVALVFNKLLVNHESVQSEVIVPGRALLVSIEWHRGDRLRILAVYAPTTKAENKAIWSEIEDVLSAKSAADRPDIVLGDFNFVEDAIDRFPSRTTDIDMPDTFSSLKQMLRVIDGWRDCYPNKIEWSWRNSTRTTMSRLDRIYVTEAILSASREWVIAISDVTRDDHSRVSVQIANLDMPEIGGGRWAMSESLTRDKIFLDECNKLGRAAQERIEAIVRLGRSAGDNPQTVWQQFKNDLTAAARKRQKEINCARNTLMVKLQKEREGAKDELRLALTDDDVNKARDKIRVAEQKMHKHGDDKHRKIFLNRATRVSIESETMSRSWFSWAKENKTKETMSAMKVPGSDPPTYITDSTEMAEAARDYHSSIQQADIDAADPARETKIEEVLSCVDTQATNAEFDDLERVVSREDIDESINLTPARKAAGIDGIIYELWKTLQRKFENSKKSEKPWFDVSRTMELVFTDVERHGVDASTEFTTGWMCPLYKKGERSDITNYRPITLLNTDYKIYTKILALKLARAAPNLIHPAQAGFVRGRSITDHTKITSLMLDYAEAAEENGAIVALDQEKAYDRIRHDYLKSALLSFGLPQRFVRIVEALYENAYTRVLVNGKLSSAYRVTRGVRQGDPLSCLLFNLAIEPLAIMLRNSELKGYDIEGLEERLIATLYADDTTVYLRDEDSYEALTEILSKWCDASGAKFNEKKTEIIPCGERDFRRNLITSRRLNETDGQIPEGIRIARDGEATRILGSWPGNGIEVAEVWSKVLEKVQERLERWEYFKPSLNGRSMISRVVIGGLTQYLTAAQGMPRSIEKKLDKITLDFLWSNSKRHPVNMATLRQRKEQGGIGLFCAEERNEAQYITWLSAYLAPVERRPIWAFIGDGVMRRRITKVDAKKVGEEIRTDPFSQNWNPNMRKLPFILKQIVRVSRKYGLVMDGVLIPDDAKESIPIWTHPAMLGDMNLVGRGAGTLCLRRHHAVRTVEDLVEIAEPDEPEHVDSDECECANCEADRAEGCRHPHRCQAIAAEIIGNIAEKWNPATAMGEPASELVDVVMEDEAAALEAGEMVLFKHLSEEEIPVPDLFRIFGTEIALERSSKSEIMTRTQGARAGVNKDLEALTAIVCGGMANDSTDDAEGGYVIKFADGARETIMSGCHGHGQTYLKTMAEAILRLMSEVPREQTVHIVCPSKQIIDCLTRKRKHHSDRGWIDRPGEERQLRLAAAALEARTGETSFTHVTKKRLAEWPEVKEVVEWAKGAAEFADPDIIDLPDLTAFDTPGLRLQGITQNIANRAIRLFKKHREPARRTTARNIDRIKSDMRAEFGCAPTSEQIWLGVASLNHSRKVRNFLWKGIHGAHKVGDYFKNMPDPWGQMMDCPTCDVPETMEHILLECPDSKQRRIWQMVRWFMAHQLVEFEPSIGIIWGCGSVRIEDSWGSIKKDVNRAFSIVVGESAFLAWKIRCEKRIEHADDPDWQVSDAEVTARWKDTMKVRRQQDLLSSRSQRFKGKTRPRWEVSGTWRDRSNVDTNKFGTPRTHAGVLVGMAGYRQRVGIG